MELNKTSDVLNCLISFLSERVPGAEIINPYPSEIGDFPIKKPTVSVSIKKLVLPWAEGMLLGSDGYNYDYYGLTATCDMELDICVPKSMSGIDCYNTFDLIADALLKMTDLNIINLYCEDISYDRILGALVLKGGIRLSAELSSTNYYDKENG